MEYEELSRLENIVEKLLSQFGDLNQAKEKLEAELVRKDQEITDLRDAAAQLKEEKNIIHGRVSSLISSLEKWEKGQTATAQPEVAASQQELQYPESPERLGLEARS